MLLPLMLTVITLSTRKIELAVPSGWVPALPSLHVELQPHLQTRIQLSATLCTHAERCAGVRASCHTITTQVHI